MASELANRNTPTPRLLTLIPADIANIYLANVAKTLSEVIIPALDGHQQARATDCLRVISRLVSDTALSPDVIDILSSNNHQDPLIEGSAIELANTEGEYILTKFSQSTAEKGRAFDHIAFAEYLVKHALGGPDTVITQARLLPGGRSKVTALLTQHGATDLPNEIVVRQDWQESVTGKAVALEYELLQQLYSRGLKVPEPLLFEPSAQVCGNPFLVFPKLAGIAVSDHFMGLPSSEDAILELADQIGQLHSIPVDVFAGLDGITESHYTPDQLRTDLATFGATIEKLDTEKSPLLHKTLSWLNDHAEQVSSAPKALVHGDLGFHNMLVDGNQFSAILDWELAHLGNPAYDLGYLRHAITDNAQWDRFMGRYTAAGGPQVPAEFVDYFCLYTGIWYHQIQLQVRTALCNGAIQDIEISALVADFAPRVLASISRTLHRVLRRTT